MCGIIAFKLPPTGLADNQRDSLPRGRYTAKWLLTGSAVISRLPNPAIHFLYSVVL